MVPFIFATIAPVQARYVTPQSGQNDDNSLWSTTIKSYNNALKVYNNKGLKAALDSFGSLIEGHDKNFIMKNFMGVPELPEITQIAKNKYQLNFKNAQRQGMEFEVINFKEGTFKLNGQIFTYDGNLSFEENTNRVMNLFNSQQHSSFNFLNLFINQAHANGGGGNKMGIWIAAGVGLLAILLWNNNKKRIENESKRLEDNVAASFDSARRADENNAAAINQLQQDFNAHVEEESAI